MSEKLLQSVLRVYQKTSKPGRFWMACFAVWFLLLTGAFNRWTGGPGFIQWFKISRLLSAKQAKLAKIESAVLDLSSEQVRLEKSPVAQRREIRRVLGYLGQNELLFDFSSDRVQPDRILTSKL